MIWKVCEVVHRQRLSHRRMWALLTLGLRSDPADFNRIPLDAVASNGARQPKVGVGTQWGSSNNQSPNWTHREPLKRLGTVLMASTFQINLELPHGSPARRKLLLKRALDACSAYLGAFPSGYVPHCKLPRCQVAMKGICFQSPGIFGL